MEIRTSDSSTCPRHSCHKCEKRMSFCHLSAIHDNTRYSTRRPGILARPPALLPQPSCHPGLAPAWIFWGFQHFQTEALTGLKSKQFPSSGAHLQLEEASHRMLLASKRSWKSGLQKVMRLEGQWWPSVGWQLVPCARRAPDLPGKSSCMASLSTHRRGSNRMRAALSEGSSGPGHLKSPDGLKALDELKTSFGELGPRQGTIHCSLRT